jgi:DoxX-like family
MSNDSAAPRSKALSVVGYVLSGLAAAFMFFDGGMKLVKPEFVVKATVETVGFPENVIVPLGVVLVGSTLLYVIPRTAVWGAILLTGYLGGAVAAHVRLGEGCFPILLPVVFAAVIWGGLCLRDERLRALLFWQL